MKKYIVPVLLSFLIFSLSGCSLKGTADPTTIQSESTSEVSTETSAEASSNSSEETSQVSVESETSSEMNSESSAVANSETSAEDNSESTSETSTDSSYDTSTLNDAYALQDGDALVGGTYEATEDDQSGLEASGTVTAEVTGSLILKTAGDASSADASSFYGVNSAIRVYDNATLTLKDVTVEASADNATGVFAYDGGTIYIYDSDITVTGGGAGGVQVAGGGTLYGYNLTVSTTSKAPIRSDRGGGLMVIDGGTYTTTGTGGCPAIYSTADITVKNATLTSENSRAVIIEGKNSVALENCILTGNDQSTKEGSVKAAVLLYQSMSGDASVGTSEFTITGGSLTTMSGALFYCTNTNSVINLTGAELLYASTAADHPVLLIVSDGRWGSDGSNGGDCELNASAQELYGAIIVDSISSLELNLADGSTFTGSINEDGEAGEVSVALEDGCTWTLTGDSYITDFDGDLAGVIASGYHLYVDGVQVV